MALPKNEADEHKAAIVVSVIDADRMSTRMAASMLEVDATLSSWPQLGSDVALGGASATAAVRMLALGRPLASGRRYVDLERTIAAEPAATAVAETPPPAPSPPLGAAHPERADDVPATVLRIVEHAVRAPSGGNGQPWHFYWDADRLWIVRDAARARSLLDGRGNAALLTLGAAIENAVVAAAVEGLAATVETFPIEGAPDVVAALRLQPADGEELARLAALGPLVAQRRTDRRLAPRRAVATEDLAVLAVGAASHGADVQWRSDPAALAELGRIVGISDRIRMLCPATHAALRGELRFDAGDPIRAHDGITVSSLALSQGKQAAVKLALRPDVAALLREIGGGSRLEESAWKSLAAASAAGLLTLRSAGPEDWLRGGRALQRLWLAATEHGISLQPLTVVLYQLQMLDGQQASVYSDAEAAELRSLERRLYDVFERRGPAAMLFRIARIDGAPERSLRLPASWMLTAGPPP